MTHIYRSLIIGCSALALAGCGAEEIASPGTGGNITINNPPTPTPTPTPTGTATVTAAAGCPTISDPAGLTDEGTISGPTGEYRVCALPARFTASANLPYIKGLLYRMNGRVDVGTDGGPAPDTSDGLSDTNVQLNIEPGVIVYASGSSFLMVNRGNRINAAGTSARPIIFTSRDNVLGLNNENSSGQWGGIVLGGRAPVTDCIAPAAVPGSVNCERQVEGAAQPAIFGGATTTDNSGTLSFVQIRYSGFVLSGDNELQSLTTGGTGTGTTFNNVMSYNSSDDGVEFFGGFVNMKGLVVVGAEDDSIDTDTGVKANLQYVVAVQRSEVGDGIIEADSNNGLEDQTPRQNTRISNATFIQRRTNDQSVRIRGGTDYALLNTLLVDGSQGTACLRIDLAQTVRAANAGLDDVGTPIFNSLNLDCATDFRDGSGGVTAANVQTIFNAGSNNNASYVNSLSGFYLNGANENALVAFDPTTLSTFFDNAGFVGAARGNDTRFLGWTCDSAAITFGSNTGACTSLPVY
ncbi:hypothetical protein GCM10023115_54950 [Pontixanthobacter gangjinensis]|uniref:Lipoprotein n=1 Tax=Pontixanthobacter gangjinensis TaxID=1028742 RepID=A0A6I4SPR3_9SPHN|nr:hypothetical protein [Pontixanthobacter gangjinensis]MXO57774.1 hypothetical protein [Pontixanthobacter gangjinensis]